MKQNKIDKQNVKESKSSTSHILFGSMFKTALIPLNLDVESSYEIGKAPPQLDVLIIRKRNKNWSKDQLKFLPDGIRHTSKKHIILELKYTESINHTAILQSAGYLAFYVKYKKINIDNACVFIVSSKTPDKENLKKLNFKESKIKGIYKSQDILLEPVKLISLNDLTDEDYNLWIKLFSSKKKQKLSILKKLIYLDLKNFNKDLITILFKIINFWNKKGEYEMKKLKKDLSSDLMNLDEISDEVAEFMACFIKPEIFIKKLTIEDRLKGLKPEDRVKGLDIKFIEQYLKKAKQNI